MSKIIVGIPHAYVSISGQLLCRLAQYAILVQYAMVRRLRKWVRDSLS